MTDSTRPGRVPSPWTLVSLALIAGVAAVPSSGPSVRLDHVVDLSHTLSSRFPVIPVPGVTFPFEQTPIATIEKNGVFANKWRLIDHNGTHTDAPIHFIPGAAAMEAIPVRDLIVPIAVVDVSARARRDPDTLLSVADVRTWERAHGRLPRHAGLFMYSGWGEKAETDPKSFVGLDASGKTHFPGFSPDAITFLLNERDIAGIGVDTLSFDPTGPGEEYPVHKGLFRAGKWGIECLANLQAIPAVGATAVIGALKVEGASASPSRVIAVW